MPSQKRISTLFPFFIACVLTALLPVLGAAGRTAAEESDGEMSLYMSTPPNDVVARLQKEMDHGSVHLDFTGKNGYLGAVLKQLKIPVASQMLVFSKTSFQRQLIFPDRPRAVYFNDQAYVGWVQGAPVLEIATVDPQLGAVFYVLEQRPNEKPKFIRQTFECLQCHSGSLTEGNPGHIMRSVYVRKDGQPDLRSGTYLTTDQSPMCERWGGWYVTGTHGTARHMGNVCTQGMEGEALLDREAGANIMDLKGRVDTAPYLSPHSDLVALLVLGHQAHVQNLITRAHYQTRTLLREEEALRKAKALSEGELAASRLRRLKSACEPLLKALLFAEEESLPGPVAGVSGFAEQFERQGPKDRQGRSLYQLDLHHRLMRYPCSYLIYSDSLKALPAPAKSYLYRRLWEILSGQEKSDDFMLLTASDRTTLREILTETSPDFAAARP